METKDYTLEVISELVNSASYAKELARKIKISHAGVNKILKELKKRNIADYVTEGKNKVYSLKKTIEAMAQIIMAEEYKLVKIIAKYPLLRGIIEKIQNNKQIKIALLFGSYAKGTAGKESDIDIYIDTNDNSIKKNAEQINTKLSVKIGSYNESNLLIKEINKNHVIIKGVEEYYAKRKILE
jgi:predicted nucleotidyltransferase/biotin operon repressor